ncbi:aldolase [Ktedonobacter racemifer DSM 44963]|uniref:Aldolase n=1 Tax=Ktedonobacter racemifer DSM 44963 TaxID=485913 RepID=D6TZL9_KTERA|nr:aldolase [Ktedonobacter racemifer DSM 44963]
MYQWAENNCQGEWEEGWNKQQPIRKALEQQFRSLFERLNVFNTQSTLAKYV